MIKADRLAKSFDRRAAVRGVTFEVGKGEVLGFLGPNGAGKTTTMRMITGFLRPDSGTASVNGHDAVREPVEARRAIGYLPENAPAYGDMTVAEFLGFIAGMRGYRGGERDDRVEAVLEKCLLRTVRHQPIDTLSKGYRQRTCFAQAILHDPPVLILDEPTEGLDPNQKKVVRDMIRDMGREKAIVLSTHILEEVEAICTRAIIISDGRIVADGTPADLKRRSRDYNAVTVRVAAPADEVVARLRRVEAARSVETRRAPAGGGECVVRVYPHDGRPVLEAVLAALAEKGWSAREVLTSDGRLDDVFRRLTTTADTAVAGAGKEAA